MAMGSSYISPAIERVWLGAKQTIPGVRLGGIFARKRGYHNTRRNNQASWPGDYSIRLSMDKQGSATLAAAIDLTMSTTEMKKRTAYLRRSALDARDDRLRCLREFIGTLNGRRVFCLIGGNAGLGEGRGEEDWGRDSSHLWHVHLSILRAFAADWAALEGIVSVLSGESWEAWIARKGGSSVSNVPTPTLREGDSGPDVAALQRALNEAIGAGLTTDGDFGPATAAAVRVLQERAGITRDSIYGPASARALADLLEDDMSWDEKIPLVTGQGVSYSGKEWPASFVLASGHYYTLKYGQTVVAEQAKQTALLQAIAAGQSGLTEEAIAAAVADGVRAAIPPVSQIAEAVAAAIDHDLDTAAVAEALREVLGGLDGSGE